jgi:hypothetical protein
MDICKHNNKFTQRPEFQYRDAIRYYCHDCDKVIKIGFLDEVPLIEKDLQ